MDRAENGVLGTYAREVSCSLPNELAKAGPKGKDSELDREIKGEANGAGSKLILKYSVDFMEQSFKP
jgi:hypothetical protein